MKTHKNFLPEGYKEWKAPTNWDKYQELDLKNITAILMKDPEAVKFMKAVYLGKGDAKKISSMLGVQPGPPLVVFLADLWKKAADEYWQKLKKETAQKVKDGEVPQEDLDAVNARSKDSPHDTRMFVALEVAIKLPNAENLASQEAKKLGQKLAKGF